MSDLVDKVVEAIRIAELERNEWIEDRDEVAARAAIIATLNALAVEFDSKAYTTEYQGSNGPYSLTFDLRVSHSVTGGARLSDVLRDEARDVEEQ